MFRLKVGSRFLQYYFLSGIIILAGFGYLYTRYLINQIEKETEVRSRIYAQYMRRVTEPDEENSAELNIIFEEVIKKIDFPVVITDAQGNLVSATNIPSRELMRERFNNLLKRLSREHEPITLSILEDDTTRVLGKIYYGISSATKILRNYPFFQIGFLAAFIFIGIWAIVVYHKREQELIWTILAKETAHQLATPISSLSGWLDALKSQLPKENNLYLLEMESDLERMKEILERFSRIGLPPELKESSLKEIIEKTVNFIKRRASTRIEFITEINYNPRLYLDEILFSWTLENLLKNSIDAIGSNEGKVLVRVNKGRDTRSVQVEVIDNGPGITPKVASKIFKTGESTKKYGWGVGLTLAKRIIEEYHQGRLFLKSSQPGETIFTILLPLNKTK
jgi:signal transduction histidine kinase